ncbi:MAG: gamma-glutamyltransferase [Candidatus Marinimicrobia bacterium]|nr:gamma-glutamyltransferase [Candidatus Neomarinimicrobiota bacterium]MCH7762713.1 gamma-glutamyltransferase [Candidatus Neomarinimicrobiota bacterium]
MVRSMKIKIILLLLFVSTFHIHGASQNPVFAKNGMVVSTSLQASEAGIEILKKGGNAVDAAVATGFALAVTSSSNGNIGGGGFMVAYLADGTTFTLDHRETSPVSAHRDMYLNEHGKVIENMSLKTRAASGVPGTVDGLLTAWEDYGSGHITLRELLTPAIKLAGKGFALSHYEAQRLNNFRELFAANKAAAAIFIRKDNLPWKAGDLLIQKDLAKTMKRIASKGRNGFYTGKTADLIVEEMQRGNGLIAHEDLLNYESKYRSAVIGTFHGYEIISMGPPSSGGALLIHMLNMLEHYPLASLGWNSSDYIHILTEVERRAYADRAEHLGDPDFWDVPLNMLLSKDYATKRIQNISMEKASKSTDIFAGDLSGYESRETTHYSVVDKDGNVVSVTTTINLSYGSGILVPGAGFFLNNEMDDFSSKPGVPNVFGLIGNEANAIEPGKRPLSSMTPTIVLKNSNPFMIIGSSGGSTIITTTLQSILNVIVHGMDVKEAVSFPRFHSQWLPDVIMTEPNGLSKDTIRNLKRMGHTIVPYHGTVRKPGYIGQANGIIINEKGFWGGGDTRGETSAIGY